MAVDAIVCCYVHMRFLGAAWGAQWRGACLWSVLLSGFWSPFSCSRRKGTEGPRFVSTDASSRCRSWVWRVIMMTLRGHFMSSGIPLPPCGHEWAETTEWCRVRCPQVAPPAATTTEATEHRADAPHMGPRMGKEQRFSDRFLSKKKPPYPP